MLMYIAYKIWYNKSVMGTHKTNLKTTAFNTIMCALLATMLLTSVAQADLVVSYETSETSLSVTAFEFTPAIVTGGTSGAPAATEGARVLKCSWTDESDGKVEVRHTGVNINMAGFNFLLVDIYMTTDLFAGSSNGLIGIYDNTWPGTWYQAISVLPAANQWCTVAFDISSDTTTETTIYAFLLENMSVNNGTFYLDNIRTVVDIPLYRPAENPATTEQGLRYEYFTGTWSKLPGFESLEPDQNGYIANFDITGAPASDNFGYSFKGFIDIGVKGTYTFYTESDDGSELYIGGNLVVDNNGGHASTEESGSISLDAGKHAITVKYFENAGLEELVVSYEGPGISKTAIPNSVLYREVLSGDYNDDGRADLYDLAVIGQQWLTTYAMSDAELLANNWLKGNTGLQIKNGWLHIDNEKFFVKGIGYEAGARPYQYPWSRVYEPDVITMDMNRIIDGRFNTIRTWGQLMEEELELIDSMGLKILFGIAIDQAGDYGNSAFITNAENDVRNTLAYSKNYDCIITYLIMNEPQPTDISAAGAAETAALWDRIKTIINTEHPGVPVSFANTGWGHFIDMNVFDASIYNLYMYGPSVRHSLEYTGFVDYAKNQSPDNPLVLSEYGLSISPAGPGNYGYGGNTLTEQTDGDLYMYRGLIDGNGQGGCVFNYLDGWWKNNNTANDADTHDDEAEEWYGLFGIIDETFLTPTEPHAPFGTLSKITTPVLLLHLKTGKFTMQMYRWNSSRTAM
jgi:PA14 domain-containing protein